MDFGEVSSELRKILIKFKFLDPDGFEFYIVSLDNKQWHFEAANSEERDEWVFIIEQEIFKSLQGNESLKPKTQNSGDLALLMQNIRTSVPGNGFCVDCDSPSELKIYCLDESEFYCSSLAFFASA